MSFKSAYGRYSILLLIVTIYSLTPAYFAYLVEPPADLPQGMLLHGAAFLLWYILFTVQIGLRTASRIGTHKTLGYLSLGLVAVLVVNGGQMLIGIMASYDPAWSEAFVFGRTSFVWAIGHTLVFFTGFYLLGVLNRKNSAAHKRYMMLASLSMISATVTRFAYLPYMPLDGTTITLLSTYLAFLIPWVIDLVQRRRIHRVLFVGTLLYLATQIACLAILPSTELGRALAFPF